MQEVRNDSQENIHSSDRYSKPPLAWLATRRIQRLCSNVCNACKCILSDVTRTSWIRDGKFLRRHSG